MTGWRKEDLTGWDPDATQWRHTPVETDPNNNLGWILVLIGIGALIIGKVVLHVG